MATMQCSIMLCAMLTFIVAPAICLPLGSESKPAEYLSPQLKVVSARLHKQRKRSLPLSKKKISSLPVTDPTAKAPSMLHNFRGDRYNGQLQCMIHDSIMSRHAKIDRRAIMPA